MLDSPDRENEGDLVIAASHLTTAKAAFLIRYSSGYICAPMPPRTAERLSLSLMVPREENSDPNRTCYAVTVDWDGESDGEGEDGGGVTTGISAHDRALTCRMLARQSTRAEQFRRPGHVVPLVSRPGGVRERRGHTEAAVDLCRLAGLEEHVGVICEMVVDGKQDVFAENEEEDGEGDVRVIVNGSGASAEKRSSGGADGGRKVKRNVPELRGSGMMRRDDCLEFGRRWGIEVCTIEDLVKFVEEQEGVE